MHLRQPGVTYSALQTIYKKKTKSIQKFEETEDSQYIY